MKKLNSRIFLYGQDVWGKWWSFSRTMYHIHKILWLGAKSSGVQDFQSLGKLTYFSGMLQAFPFSQDFGTRVQCVWRLTGQRNVSLANYAMCKFDFQVQIWTAKCAGSGHMFISQDKRTAEAFVQRIQARTMPLRQQKEARLIKWGELAD